MLEHYQGCAWKETKKRCAEPSSRGSYSLRTGTGFATAPFPPSSAWTLALGKHRLCRAAKSKPTGHHPNIRSHTSDLASHHLSCIGKALPLSCSRETSSPGVVLRGALSHVVRCHICALPHLCVGPKHQQTAVARADLPARDDERVALPKGHHLMATSPPGSVKSAIGLTVTRLELFSLLGSSLLRPKAQVIGCVSVLHSVDTLSVMDQSHC